VGGVRNDLHYCLDYNLWLKFHKAGGNFSYIKKPLSATRIYGATKGATGGEKYVDEIRSMLLDEVGYIPNIWKLYYEYSKEKGFYSGNSFVKFWKTSGRFLIGNPKTITEFLPFAAYMTKYECMNFLARFRAPYGKHYSCMK
jgi:hypothetical protein